MATVTINKHALVKFVLESTVQRVALLHELVCRTLLRLGRIRQARRAKPYKAPPHGVGNFPNILDVRRWLDAVTPADSDDIDFIERVYATSVVRLGRDHVMAEGAPE